MNRSYSKIRHIQEANILLEKRMLIEVEQPATTSGASETQTTEVTKSLPLSQVKTTLGDLQATTNTQSNFSTLLNSLSPKLDQLSINQLKQQLNNPSEFLNSLGNKLEEKGIEAEIEFSPPSPEEGGEPTTQSLMFKPELKTKIKIPGMNDLSLHVGVGQEGLSNIGLTKTWTIGGK